MSPAIAAPSAQREKRPSVGDPLTVDGCQPRIDQEYHAFGKYHPILWFQGECGTPVGPNRTLRDPRGVPPRDRGLDILSQLPILPRTSMTDRLAYLERLAETGKLDAFARYALAMEYRRAGRSEEALHVFADLREQDPSYLPMYLMAGQLLLQMQAFDEARTWLERGLKLARDKQDAKAASEIERALSEC